jgi:PIN domain nuclease of toxin-antitoxin system
MTCLLDTHAFLWAAMAPEKLSSKMQGVIADTTNEIHVSTISFWEISLKFSLGKLELVGCSPEELVAIAGQMQLEISPPLAEESASFHRLPKYAHKDPFDRMLIWQCLQRRWALITCDQGLDQYLALGLRTAW